MSITIGVDIGQKRDPTAACVAEKENRRVDGRTGQHFLVRHLERLPPGTAYPEVARRIGKIVGGVQQRTQRAPGLLVDATGVGKPIVDPLREQAMGVRPGRDETVCVSEDEVKPWDR